MAPPIPLEAPSDITAGTKFSWPVVVAIVGVALFAAGANLTAHAADDKATDAEVTLHKHELRIQRVEDAQIEQLKRQEKIEAKLDAILDELRRQNK